MTTDKIQAGDIKINLASAVNEVNIELFSGFLNLAGSECNAGGILFDQIKNTLFLSPKALEIIQVPLQELNNLSDLDHSLGHHLGNSLCAQFQLAFDSQNKTRFDYQLPNGNNCKVVLNPIKDQAKMVGMISEIDHAHTPTRFEGIALGATFEHFFHTSTIPISIVDLKGNFKYVNSAWVDLLGYTLEELHEKSFAEITHPDDLDKGFDALNNLKSGLKKHVKFEKRYLAKTGKTVHVELTSTKSTNLGKDPDFLITHLKDLTQIKENEQKLIEEAAKQNDSLKRLRIKHAHAEDFSHIVSHNLRTPAGNIQMLIDLFIQAQDDSERKEWADALRSSSAALLGTLQELMSLIQISSRGSLDFEELDFKEMIQVVLQEHSESLETLKPKISINTEALERIKYPKVYLHSILLNLISNAIKYRSYERPLDIAIETGVENNRPFLKISDNGIGIDLNKYGSQLFQLNGKFTNRENSNGFGLYMTKRQIDLLEGKITCESTPEQGTSFTIQF